MGAETFSLQIDLNFKNDYSISSLSLGDRIVGDFEFIFYTYFEFCNFPLKEVLFL